MLYTSCTKSFLEGYPMGNIHIFFSFFFFHFVLQRRLERQEQNWEREREAQTKLSLPMISLDKGSLFICLNALKFPSKRQDFRSKHSKCRQGNAKWQTVLGNKPHNLWQLYTFLNIIHNLCIDSFNFHFNYGLGRVMLITINY